MTNIAISGAAGRMGQRLVALGHEDPDLSVVAGIDAPASPSLGKDLGVLVHTGAIGIPLTDHLPESCAPDAIIDFSVPAAMRNIIEVARTRRIPLVIGTTGLVPEDQTLIDNAAKEIPVLYASNFSLVVNVLNLLSAKAAQLLGPDYDIEIVEAHHRFKKDAPSGTALTLAQHICDATDRDFEQDVVLQRHGDDCQRQPNEITVQAIRIGDHPGEHTAYFATLGERLELKHVSTSRDSYVLGALRAAKWLRDKPAGRYDMRSVLGLDD
ncbi:4-hydroxy-tetrahydrodipicolinate reductase [Poriferisphaera sp. WC338]|uniref:4-hydroxy-tetrahydrodipicolinate reductase n=1 Tax=Poriferisphaera sp. WC338 TaxID=3425129 RepID=UPI003D81C28B